MSWPRYRVGIVCLLLPSVGTAASQLTPFFEGLKAARGVEQRRAYLKSEYRAPGTLVISEEMPILIDALRNDDPLVTFLAGEYLLDLATRHIGDPTVGDQLRTAASALLPHFDDPEPVETSADSDSRSTPWHSFVLTYLQYVSLPLPSDLIPAVEAALYDPRWGFLAVRGLAGLKPMPTQVLNALLEKMNDPQDLKLRQDIILVLADHLQGDSRVMAWIIEMLASSDREQQRFGALAAGAMGSAGERAMPYLRQILSAKDLTEQTRHDIESALNQLEQGKPTRASASIQEIDQRMRAARAADPPTPKPMSIRAYFELLRAAKPQERQTVVKDFRALPNGQSMAPSNDVPFLIEALNDRDAELAETAAGFLLLMAMEYGGAGTNVRNVIATALPAMEAHFDDPTIERPLDFGNRHRWRMMVIRFVSVTGVAPAGDLLAKMLKAIDDENEQTAVLAMAVLAEMKPMTPQILDAVISKMDSPSPEMRRAVMQGLAMSRNSDPRFIVGLAASLDDSAVDHQPAASALAELGASAKAAEPALRRLISKEAPENTPEGIAQMYARIALEKIATNK
jgi:hypothetical protein